MKKFIISFEYKSQLLSAKVLIHKIDNTIIYSSLVLGLDAPTELEGVPLVFLEGKEGFQLFLLNSDHSFTILKWHIKLQYLDKGEIVYPEKFSLS